MPPCFHSWLQDEKFFGYKIRRIDYHFSSRKTPFRDRKLICPALPVCGLYSMYRIIIPRMNTPPAEAGGIG